MQDPMFTVVSEEAVRDDDNATWEEPHPLFFRQKTGDGKLHRLRYLGDNKWWADEDKSLENWKFLFPWRD